MEDLSIDQTKLPGVKEVCRDFAVLEDHTLAHSLQEQEIENHLASNIHKSRLVQQDLQVARRLQEEEDLRAKARIQKQHRELEHSDNEIAQEIQEQLVRQAELQRQQEENDAAIARKLQEKEMKEERRRQKQLETNFKEEYYDEKGASQLPSDTRKGKHSEWDSSEWNEHAEHSPPEITRGRHPKCNLSDCYQGKHCDQGHVRHIKSKQPSDSNPVRLRKPELSEYRREETHHGYNWLMDPREEHSFIIGASGELSDSQDSLEFEMIGRQTERPAELSTSPRHHGRDKRRKRERNGEGCRGQEWDKEANWDRDRIEWEGKHARDCKRDEVWEKEKNKERDRERDRDRGWERNKDRNSVWESERDRDRSRECERDKGRGGEWERDRHRNRERDRNGVRDRDNSREQDKSKDWEMVREGDGEREGGSDRNRERNRYRNNREGGRDRDLKRDREWDRERQWERDKDEEQERDKEGYRNRERDRDGDNSRGGEKDRDNKRGREWGSDKDRVGEQDGDRNGDRNGDREGNNSREGEKNRDRTWDRNLERERDRDKRVRNMEGERGRDKKRNRNLEGERDTDKKKNMEGERDTDKKRNRNMEGMRDRNRSKDQDNVRHKDSHNGRDLDGEGPGLNQIWLEGKFADQEHELGRRRVISWDDEFLYNSCSRTERRGERRDHWDSREEVPRARSCSHEDTSQSFSPGGPGRMAHTEYGMRDVVQGVGRMDLREQEIRDLEVARKMQEDELKASETDKRAAQVAQDAEIARLLMEEEKRVYKKSRDREKPCMDPRRPEGDEKPGFEEVLRPRSREEHQQRSRNHKADRPPAHSHDYENMDSSYLYPAAHYPGRAAPGPETTYKGSYNRQ